MGAIEKNHITRKQIGRTADGTKVMEVSGPAVRDKTDADFIGGGHHFAYPKLIPTNEIWVERMRDKADEKAIEIHEVTEYTDMRYHKMNYANSHNHANKVESKFREGETTLDKVLKAAHGKHLK